MAIELTSVQLKEIFPSTKTTTINKLITENSLTRLLNRLVDVDGYIISSEFDNEEIAYDYNYVNTSSEIILNSNMEICIRGYYFNLGLYRDLIGKITTTYPDLEEHDVIKAAIFIDNSNPDYPEMFGQDSFVEHTIYNEGEEYPTFESGYISSTLLFLDGNGDSVNINNFTIDSNNQGTWSWSDLTSANVVAIRYYTRVSDNCIWLYRDTEGDIPDYPTPSDDYTMHELVLFEALEDEDTNELILNIPITSFHKFSSVSVSTIDGGVIDPQ